MSSGGAIHATADRFRREMLARERRAASEMVRRYAEMWRRLEVQIRALTRTYYEAVAAGQATSPAWVWQLERAQALRAQVERELREFARFADGRITAEQWEAVTAAHRHNVELVVKQLQTTEAGLARLGIGFNSLPKEAIGDLIGFMQNGSPLRELLDRLGAAASEQVQRELVTGLGLGLGPREIAARCRAAFGGNLNRALTVARTETMRAYREASTRDMQANSDLVDGWIWMSGNDGRTCAACLAMHGTVHPLGARLDDHPNGRCSQIPHTVGWAALGQKYGIDMSGVPDSRVQVTPGTELFARMSSAEQLALLGPAKYAAYRDGKLSLTDLVGQAHSAAWGSHRYERSLAEILGTAQATEYRKGKAA